MKIPTVLVTISEESEVWTIMSGTDSFLKSSSNLKKTIIV